MSGLVLSLFSGIGGWERALGERGYTTWAVEHARWPRASLVANGLEVVHDDVTTLDPALMSLLDGVVFSAPCQAWSQANGNALGEDDPRGRLVWQALRVVRGTWPRFVCGELTPRAVGAFEALAAELRRDGYTAEVRLVDAADHGLPQARRRVLLAASWEGPVRWPEPTHAGRHVTLAQALPHRNDLPGWAHGRAATTVVGSFCPEVLAAPGWRRPGDPPRQRTPDSVVTTVEERLLLQGFPPGWVVCGPPSAQGLQVGNAIPPVLADVALRAVLTPTP